MISHNLSPSVSKSADRVSLGKSGEKIKKKPYISHTWPDNPLRLICTNVSICVCHGCSQLCNRCFIVIGSGDWILRGIEFWPFL